MYRRSLALVLMTLSLVLPSGAVAGKRKEKEEVAAVHAQIQGEWHVRPPAVDPLMAAMRLVVREPPPTEQELSALGLPEEHLAKLKAAVLPQPSEAMKQEARSTLERAEQVRVVVTEDRLSLRRPGSQTEELVYAVTGGSADRLQVVVTGPSGQEQSSWILHEGGVRVLEGATLRFRLERVEAGEAVLP